VKRRFYGALSGSSLGDDTSDWQGNVLSQLQLQSQIEASRAREERAQRYMQLAATLCIPVAAWVWSALLEKRGRRGTTHMVL